MDLLAKKPLLIGVVHLKSLPGSPGYGGNMQPILDAACADARNLEMGGVDGLIVENFGDMPLPKETLPPETIAAMAVAGQILASRTELPLGFNCLRNDSLGALAICAATGGAFLRVNVLTGAYATDQGIIEGRAFETLRQRDALCGQAKILADVHVKHAKPLHDTQSLADAARECAHRGLADGLIVTGDATGSPPQVKDLQEVRQALPAKPLLIGSGCNPENISDFLQHADGAIVGTYFKEGGDVRAPVDPSRVQKLVQTLKTI